MKRRERKPLKPLIPKAGGPSPSKIDPTGTTSIRRAMITLIRGKFARLKGKIVTLIAKEDALGLITPSNVPIGSSTQSTKVTGHITNTPYDISLPGVSGRATGNTDGYTLINVPNIKQPNEWSCGSACAFSVGSYYGVGPKTLKEWSDNLGTNPESGTDPLAIARYLKSLGLGVSSGSGMSLGDLESYTAQGWPIIVCVQDYGNRGSLTQERVSKYGHYLVVIGISRTLGCVFCQDPSIDNVTEGSGSVSLPGRVMIDIGTFIKIWHDRDAKGTDYTRYGIAVGPGTTGKPREKTYSSVESAIDANSFCPTGVGGGIDSSCSPNKSNTSDRGGDKDNSEIKSPGTTLLHNALERWLKDGNLSPQQAASYRDAFHTVISGMPEASRIIFHSNLDKVVFHPSTQEVTNAFRRTGGYPRGKVGGFWDFDPRSDTGKQGKGTLHVNGGSDSGEDYTGPIHLISHIYSHESGHVLDKGHLLSNSKEWREAYSSEIKTLNDPLSRAATKSPAEGFAEYARLLFLHPDKAKDKQFSKCYGAWKRHGLLEDTKMTANVLYSVDPSNTFNVLIYNGVSGAGHWVTLEGGQHVYLSGEGELLIGKDRISRYLQDNPEERLTVREGEQHGEQHESGTERGRGEGTVSTTGTHDTTGPQVATETERPGTEGADKDGSRGTEPLGKEPNQSVSPEGLSKENTPLETQKPVSEEAKQQAVGLEEANRKIDRYADLFRRKGMDEQADWMEQLRDHINEVGTQQALEGLGAPIQGLSTRQGGEQVQYGGHMEVGHFTEQYLDRHGISLIQGGQFDPNKRVISTVAPSSDEGGVPLRGKEGDVYPTLQGLRDKLHESQNLPGLEKSEDIGKLMGKEFGSRVDNFTPEVIAKLDEQYGKDQWIVKSYGDEAYAGYGIYFPQRANQLKKEAQDTIWNAGEHLSKYGFQIARDHEGKAAGLIHESGDIYPFGKVEHRFDEDGKLYTHIEGSPEYNNTIQGDARKWGDMVANASLSERGASIPPGKFMAQPAFPVVGVSNEERAAGVTFKTGQEGRVHISTKDGVASIVPHSTWLKGEHLPVVFESEDTRAMAKAAVDAINNLPISERKGQLYAPDIVKTKDGYRAVEANPANEAGASGYLQDNPMIMDSYVSHVVGREPAHIAFVRKLLSDRKFDTGETQHGKESNPTATIGESGERSSTGGAPGLSGSQPSRASSIHTQEPGVPQTPLSARQKLADKVSELTVSQGEGNEDNHQRWQHSPEVQAAHNDEVLKAAKETGLFVPSRHFSGITSSPNVGGNEHDVHEDTKNDKFYKFTKGGHFGQNKDVQEYLERHEVANKLWPELGYKVHGITESPFDGTPQVVTSMNRIEGTHPSTGEIEHWFKSNGWHPNDERWNWEDGSDAGHWSWKDPHSGTVINDAHSKNFIKTKSGKLAPIDVDILPGKKQ